MSWENLFMLYAQVDPCSLISAFVVRRLDSMIVWYLQFLYPKFQASA